MHAPAGTTVGGVGAMLPPMAQGSPRPASLPATLAFPQSRRILVIEDDAPLARLLASGLSAESFAVDLVHDGEAAARALALGNHSLVMLDLNLPTMDGLALLELLRSKCPRVPVLVLTGRSRTEDMVRALDGGADDCLLKPFSLLELMARVRVLLRRSSGAGETRPRPLGLALDRAEYRAERNGRLINLTPREFAVLDFLMHHAGQPVSRSTLMRDVWKMPHETNTNIVDVYMKYLRDKIDGQGEEKLICTVRGVGYVLRNS